MIATVAAHAESPGAAALIGGMRPIEDAGRRREENRALAEALKRQREPGAWCWVGRGELGSRLEENTRAEDGAAALDGPGLLEVLGWLGAAAETRRSWREGDAAERHPALAAEATGLPDLGALERRLAESLDPDGRPSDAASPALKRARADLARGERDLEQRLERWSRPFGEGAYVTRHGDRFVAMVPAAGFPRRRGIVHDVSGSGQSLLVEPLEACESNNRLIELRAAVQAEEHRILLELADQVRRSRAELLATERALVRLDSLRARARWAAPLGGIAVDPGGPALRLVGAAHPLLATGSRAEPVVPLDLELSEEGRLLLVSGPNMGGKTVLLKTVGLAAAMSHAALPLIAKEGTRVPELDQVLVDLGDEQSLDQGLSTFAAHLRSLARMTAEAGPRTLLLCDEMGAGTDPEEGAALGRALLEHFAARGAWAVVTTHLGSLKRAAGEVPGIVSGSLEFDAATLSPRYRFRSGIPGASHALAMAERLGFDAAVLARARALTPEESLALERLLGELADAQRRLDEERSGLDEARASARRAEADHRAAAEDARKTLADLRRRLTSESEALLARARELWQTVQREARKSEKTRSSAASIGDEVRAVETQARALDATAAAVSGSKGPEPLPSAAIRPGLTVRVRDLGLEAEVVSGPDAEGKVVLRRGSWSISTEADKLLAAPTEAAAPPRPAGAPATWRVPDDAAPLQVDLRGMDMEEALQTLDGGLDRAVLAGLSELRIVHGVGRGVLRAAVERHVREHPQVVAQRLGRVGEGGRGVTIVTLR